MDMTSDTISERGLRSFALVSAAFLGGMFGVGLPWLYGYPFPLWPWIAGLLFVLWGLFAPEQLGPVHRVWMKLSQHLGRVNNSILLSGVYLLVLVPLGILLRWLGHDPLQRKWVSEQRSYRKPSAASSLRTSMERPY